MANRPPYRLTPRQEQKLAGLIHLAQQAEDEIVETDISDKRDENDGSEERSQKPESLASIPPELTPIQRQCLRVCVVIGPPRPQWALPQRRGQCVGRTRDRHRTYHVVAGRELHAQVVGGDQIGPHDGNIAGVR